MSGLHPPPCGSSLSTVPRLPGGYMKKSPTGQSPFSLTHSGGSQLEQSNQGKERGKAARVAAAAQAAQEERKTERSTREANNGVQTAAQESRTGLQKGRSLRQEGQESPVEEQIQENLDQEWDSRRPGALSAEPSGGTEEQEKVQRDHHLRTPQPPGVKGRKPEVQEEVDHPAQPEQRHQRHQVETLRCHSAPRL
uniref:Uncharacterized protein n=1 Tax=Chromera velia CCMP2878 TaxID=1169474 RepID=A0A0G4HAU8_9ALVE|eukprot:Cvel_25766.t1-p1 / transcript=Cvel_25766.t1 / gene=Cvel_25766 / organism=Chromera_velia_CCMP2878 / gene_product=hypothetical protein / transcript_product=hypothetical protein / location=Cvel_scaffold2968:14623-15204(-) / protein_length=194 / sequence_SO=supercontig / SO=protein_coding / is_pseudo=false